MKRIILTLIVSLIWTIQIYSQWGWDNKVTAHWTTTSIDEAKYIKVKGGFVYVTGNCADNGTNFAIMTIKYDASLNSLLWQRIYTSPLGQQHVVFANGIDVDNFGNVYIVGTQRNGSNNDYVTIKYDENGHQQWAVTYDNGGDDEAGAIGVDDGSSGAVNVYVTGGSWDNLIVPSNIHTTTVSYTNSGEFRWVRRYWSVFYDPRSGGANGWYSSAVTLAVDNSGGSRGRAGVYVAGRVDNGIHCLSHDCLMDASVVYYDFNGNNVSPAWYGCGGPHPEDMPGNDFANSVVVSGSTGDVFCTGAKWCGEDCSIYPLCPPSYNHLSNYEVFTARFAWNIPGNEGGLWVDEDYCDNARYEGQMDGGEDIGNSLVVDDAPGHDYVYATGYTQQPLGGDVPDDYRDYITLKYEHFLEGETSQGIKLWCIDCHPDPDPEHICPIAACPQIYNSGGIANDIARSIAIDASGNNVFVTGTAGNPSQHIVTIQYNSSGSQVCLGEYYDEWAAGGNSIAVDNGNPASVYVAGVTKNFQFLYDFVVLKYTANNCTGDNKSSNLETQKFKVIPENYSLSQNFPNPFNPSTTISYSIPKASYVSIKIFNTLGQIVINIPVKYREPGYYSEDINALSWSSGIYFYKIEARDVLNTANTFIDTKKMLLIK